MTWAYLDGAGITVDWFTDHNRLPDLPPQVGVPKSEDDMDVATEMVGLARDETAVSFYPRRDMFNETSASDGSDPRGERSFDETAPSDLLVRARARVSHIEEQLFATAPTSEAPIRVAGRGLRGQWVPLDLVGPPAGSLLFGLLDSPLSEQAGLDITDRLRLLIRQRTETNEAGDLPPDPPATVSVRGRLFIAVAGAEFTQPWDLIAD